MNERQLLKRRDGVLKFNCSCGACVAFGVKEQQTGTMRGKKIVCPDCGQKWLIGYERTDGFYMAFLL